MTPAKVTLDDVLHAYSGNRQKTSIEINIAISPMSYHNGIGGGNEMVKSVTM
jgi:hypothetical protein